MSKEFKTDISNVTVFRDGARITRSGSMKLEPGEQTLLVSGITQDAHEDSFRVKGKGKAILKGIDVKKEYVKQEDNSEIEKLTKEIEKLEKKKEQVTDDLNFQRARQDRLIAISKQFASEFGKWYAAGEAKIDNLTNMDETTVKLLTDTKKRIRELTEEIKDLDDQLQVLHSKISDIRSLSRVRVFHEVKILVDVKETTKLFLEVSYQLNTAGWNPTYDIDIGEEKANVKRIALVRNSSREDWNDIELTVSTASARPVSAVKPKPYYIDTFKAEISDFFAGPGGRGGGVGYGGLATEADDDYMDSEEEEMMIDEKKEAFEPPTTMAERRADVRESLSGTVMYEVPGEISISSDDETHPVTLTEEDFESRRLHFWNAYAMTEVVAQDEITNSDAVLLPGKVKVYAQGDFLGETTLDMKSPREKFRLGTRVAYDVKAEKKLLDKETEKAGFTRGKNKRQYKYKIEIKSFANKPIDIKIVDRIPHSDSEKISIEAPPPSIPYKKFELGVIEWEIQVEPEKEKTIEYEYSVEWEKDIRIRPPLP
ncbi:MAG: mucoidy inhibitor MuiA family protein [Candidatus Lokiarchaeota archaeon]|nr:mucoidy inhibitor MuiA family protein [Candidatus Lokiarchaeota archaeon]